MSRREKYISFQKDGKSIFAVYAELAKANTPMHAMVQLRGLFPELSLIEAKEIMVLSETDYESLEKYQEKTIGEILKKME